MCICISLTSADYILRLNASPPYTSTRDKEPLLLFSCFCRGRPTYPCRCKMTLHSAPQAGHCGMHESCIAYEAARSAVSDSAHVIPLRDCCACGETIAHLLRVPSFQHAKSRRSQPRWARRTSAHSLKVAFLDVGLGVDISASRYAGAAVLNLREIGLWD